MARRREVSAVVTPLCGGAPSLGPLPRFVPLVETRGVAPIRFPQSDGNLDLLSAWGVCLRCSGHRGESRPSWVAPQPYGEHPFHRTAQPLRPRVGTAGLNKGLRGVRARDGLQRRVAGRPLGEASSQGAAWLLDRNGKASLGLLRRPAALCPAGRRTCLAACWRSRTSHLSGSYLKSTWKKLCVRGGPRGGQGPGC